MHFSFLSFHPSQDPLDDVDTSLVAAELITWVKSRVTLMGLTSEMWHDESSSVIISDFLSSKQNNRLIVFIVRHAPRLLTRYDATIPV